MRGHGCLHEFGWQGEQLFARPQVTERNLADHEWVRDDDFRFEQFDRHRIL